MWVLIYLITIVSSLKDKKKMYFIVGTFVITEAIMYFFILMGWLKVFEFIGFNKFIMYAISGFALWFGIYSITDFIKNKGKVVCKVSNSKSKKRTIEKIKKIATSKITIFSVLATIVLAFSVNLIEFICSAGLPALFSQILSISNITQAQKILYILVYDLFFMLDDFIIFGFALFAIDSNLIHKYSGLSKLIGGIIMIIIGIVLLFFPSLLF